MKLPSENMSLAEVRAMNGSAATYHMDAPVMWEAFKTWPEDIQAEYIERLRDRYQVNGTHIANMMHTTPAALASWRHGHGVEFGRRGPKNPGPEWADFCARPYQWSGKPAEREKPAPERETEPERATQTPADPPTPEPVTVTVGGPAILRARENIKPTAGEIQQLLDLLPDLRAAGAKIRIEVEL